MNKINDIKRLRYETDYKFSLEVCKNTYENCGCDFEQAKKALLEMLDNAVVDNSQLIEESKEAFEHRETKRKRYAVIKRLIQILIGAGCYAVCIYLIIAIDSLWIILPAVLLGMIGLIFLLCGLFPKFIAWLKKQPSKTYIAPDEQTQEKPQKEKSHILDNIIAAGMGMADGFKEGWNKDKKKENVWEDNSEDNDWLPDDE